MANEAAKLVAALEDYDAAMANVKQSRAHLLVAETRLKRAVGAKVDNYMDGNELVAALGRKLAALLVDS